MRVSVRTRKRRFLFITGEDVDATEELAYLNLTSADLSPAPEPESWEYPEEEEQKISETRFGFAAK